MMSSSSANQPSSANSAADPVEQEINDDMSFIAANIAAGGQRTAIIEGFQQELLRRRGRGRGYDTATLFAQYENVMQQMNAGASQGNYAVGCFNTLHGGPLSSTQLESVPPIFRVPDGCIIAMLAPPGTVVYGGEEEDMMS